jgi:hypothetical protein
LQCTSQLPDYAITPLPDYDYPIIRLPDSGPEW